MPRDARLLLCSLFLSSLPIGLLLVFFPLYLHDLGAQPFLIGGIFTAAGVGTSLLMLVIGPLADRWGRRPFLIVGTALPLGGFVIFALTTNTAWLVVASMLGGVGFSGGLGGGLVQTTFDPLLSGTVEPDLRTTVLSWAEAVWTLSIGLGAALAALPTLLAHAGVLPLLAADRAMFVGCLVLTLGAVLLLLPIREHGDHTAARAAAPTGRAPRPQRPPPFVYKLAVFFALQGAGLGLVVQLLPLWFALRFHTTSAVIAPWFAAGQVAGLPLILLVPRLARRFGVAGVIVAVAAVSTLFLVGVPLAPTLPLAGVFYVVRSGLLSMQWPAQISFLQGSVPPQIRGTVTSLTMSSWSLAAALLPILAGYLMGQGLINVPLALGVLCYAAAAVWFWLTLRHTALPEESSEKTSTEGMVPEQVVAR